MTVFRVGQRVRIVALGHPKYSYALGAEGVVNELDCVNEFYETGCVGVTACGEDDWAILPDHLEPILDQHQPCESEFKESLDRMLEGVSA